jgi:hypothetical protein
MYYSQSDYIFYYAPQSGELFIFELREMQEYFRKHGTRLEYKIAPDYIDGRLYKHSLGVIVPLDVFRRAGYRLQKIKLSAEMEQ